MTSSSFEAEVPGSLAGVRIDRAVAMLTGVSRSVAASLVDAGRVHLNGVAVTEGRRGVPAGASLRVELPGASVLEADPGVAFEVVHEDDAVVVVDKPAGLVVHPGAGVRRGTLAGGLLARYPELASVEGADAGRPGIVHRLDRGTSGLLVVARTAASYRSLRSQFTTRTAGRRYTALVVGHVASERGIVDAPIARSTRTPTRMALSAGGRPARTHYEVLARLQRVVSARGVRELEATLLACTLETGRTHQIRVHLASIGHPVVGDDRYGTTSRAKVVAPGVLPPGRLFLHASELTFDHPSSGRRTTWRSPLPADLAGVLPEPFGTGGAGASGRGVVRADEGAVG